MKYVRPHRYPLVIGLFALATALFGSGAPIQVEPPYSPEEAASRFEIADGFRIELFAAEPLVKDPIAMEIGDDGRIYVLELAGYPDRNMGLGQVKQLTDTDGDNLPDRYTIFADSLRMPKGIMRWKNGILVTDAPDVIYFEDTDGDGEADVRRVVVTGFNVTSEQGGVNTPFYGLDNWVHLGDGRASSELRFPDAPDAHIEAAGGMKRMRPGSYEMESGAAGTQYGYTFDRWGRQLLTSNANHIYHAVIDGRYVRRNPDLLLASAVEQIPAHGPNADVFPITVDPSHQLFTDVGVITAACGLTSYLGGAFPDEYEGVTFVGEPQHNLVHTDRLEDNGATFIARRTHEGQEFLASEDSWFRPVNMYVGPEGAMYVVDYYRDIIERPRFLSEDVMESGRLYDGSEYGRIWRIVPDEGLPLDWMSDLRLEAESDEALVEDLVRDNIWYRRTAQRLLVQRQAQAVAPRLEQLAREAARPEGRLHALWTLEGLGRLTPGAIRAALRDPVPGVRENAIRLAELHLGDTPELADDLIAMQGSAEGREAFQLLLTLGDLSSKAAEQARERLLIDHVEDEWMQVAALTAREVDGTRLYQVAVEEFSQTQSDAHRALFQRLGSFIGSGGDEAEIRSVLRRSADGDEASAWWRAASLAGLVEGLTSLQTDMPTLSEELQTLAGSFFEQPAPLRAATLQIVEKFGLPSETIPALNRAENVAADRGADAQLRTDAVRLLTLSDPSAHVALMQSLLDAREPLPLQLAALGALRPVEGTAIGRFLIDRWASLTPQIRIQAVDLLLQERDRTELFVSAMERGHIQPGVIGWPRAKRLLDHKDPDIQKRSHAFLSPEKVTTTDVVADYAEALEMEGNMEAGRAVFERACATCHQIDGQMGIDIGPDLASVRTRRAEFLIGDILLPSRDIAAGYEQWTIELESGETLTGTIAAETPAAVSVRSLDGTERLVARSDISSIEAVNMSIMPEGLGQVISVQDMADLLTFIRRAH